MKSAFATLFLLAITLIPLAAQLTFTAYPYLAYSSETRAMAGAFSFVRYDFADPQTGTSPNRISLLGNTIFSQNHQFLLALIPRYEYGAFMIDSSMEFSLWPDTFYGIGNSTDHDISESFTSGNYATETSLRYRLGQSLIASVQMDLGWHELRKTVDAGMLETMELVGKEDARHSGIGASLSFDSSGGSYYPEKGMRFELKQIWYEDALGSDFTWQKHLYDWRIYIPMGKKNVLAFQSDLEQNKGEVPYYRYPELGRRLRAYDSRRFVDKLRISQRIEHRSFPFEDGLARRLGFVLFAETGQVAPDFQEIALKDWHVSVGGGIRFSILPQERLNLRADLGFGKDSINLIINAREVF